MLKSVGLSINSDSEKIKHVCLDHIVSSSASYDTIMESVVAFMAIPPRAADGASAWAQIQAQVKELDLHRKPSAHASALDHTEKAWLNSLALRLDAQYFGGYLKHYAMLMQCAELPAEELPATTRPISLETPGSAVMPQDGRRLAKASAETLQGRRACRCE
jgi:hypothetical protein